MYWNIWIWLIIQHVSFGSCSRHIYRSKMHGISKCITLRACCLILLCNFIAGKYHCLRVLPNLISEISLHSWSKRIHVSNKFLQGLNDLHIQPNDSLACAGIFLWLDGSFKDQHSHAFNIISLHVYMGLICCSSELKYKSK